MVNPTNPYQGYTNTKEDVFDLIGKTQGVWIVEQYLTAMFVKLFKMFDSFP